MKLALDTLVVGLRAGLPAARAMVGSPAAALAVAEQLLREDPAAVADFHCDAGNLAGWLLNESRRDRLVAPADLTSPDADPKAAWLASWDRSESLRIEFGGDREAWLGYCENERRCGRTVPETVAVPAPRPVEVRAATPPAAAPEQVVPVKLAQQTTPKGSARLPLAEAGTMLGLPPLDALPLTANVLAALRDCGLDPRTEGRNVTLDARAVEWIAADSEAANALLLRLCGSVHSLCHVGGGGEIALHRWHRIPRRTPGARRTRRGSARRRAWSWRRAVFATASCR